MEEPRTERLTIRITPTQQKTIQRAAASQHLTIAQWTMSHLMEDAARDINFHSSEFLLEEVYQEIADATQRRTA